MPPTAAVDSDTNDAGQAGRKDNGDFPVAQPLSTPVQLVGSVNKPGAGPAGPNHDAGDELDGYHVTLKAGQVVELEFTADPSVNDLDLFIFDGQTQQVVGQSTGETNRYECVRISKDGDYFVAVSAYAGASIYNLRIGAPGSANSCGNATTALGAFLPRQVIAKASARSTAAAQTRRTQLMASAGLTSNGVPAGVPELLRASPSAASRAAGLRRLAAATGRTLKMSAQQPRTPALQQALDTVRYVKQLRATGLYDYVDFNRLRQKQTLVSTFPPNDPYYANQRWHYEMINLPSAMDRLVGLAPQPTQRPIVAVIDSGIVSNHPDLLPQVAEGRTFFSMTTGGDHNSDSYDDDTPQGPEAEFHGTHVSGTIAASTFDGKGAAGVAPMAQLMPLRVFTPLREGATDYDIANAALFAAGLPNSSGRLPARKADVINLSVGGVGSCPASYRDTINSVRAQGVLFVVAAGNEARNDIGRSAPVTSPGNCPGVITVSALNASEDLSYYSSSGAEVKVAAPGGDMRQSTTGTGLGDGIFSTVGTFDASGNRVPTYALMQGTSMATPHVAGVMALMRWANPAITPDQVDTLLAQGKLTDDIGAAGRDDSFGWGAINARKAVDAALELRGVSTPPAAGTVIASPSSIDFGSFQSSAEIELMLTAAGTEKVTGVTSDSAAVTTSSIDADAATGLGRYRVEVDRSKLTEGTSFPKLTVQTTTRQFTVQLTVVKPAAGDTSSRADYGRVYVLLIDDATGDAVKQASVDASNGVYRWQITGVNLSKVRIIAGTDLDNDGYLCQRGEACGAYPLLSNSGGSTVNLVANRNDLDFQIAPFGGVNTSSLGQGSGRGTPWRRELPAAGAAAAAARR
jgi:serine protease